ncbi:MauE/DoxX family redox-associated membrane protein [Fictibacillus phosphorivorans]|uniref:MauE/DoxX family redox-associated membrane protein n=1 Tax=Fictibacillus phosphorivorans TaxID=1221500 RepID=UPI003CF1D310
MSLFSSSLLILSVVFVASSFSKILRFRDFMTGIKEYEILPSSLVPLFAISTILVELLVSISYLLQKFIILASFFALILLAIYGCAIVISLVRKKDMNCHCFESFGATKLTAATLIRVILLMLLHAYVYINSSYEGSAFEGSRYDIVIYGLLTIILLLSNELLQKGLVMYKNVVKEFGN